MQQLRRALDVGEHEGHSAGREIGPHVLHDAESVGRRQVGLPVSVLSTGVRPRRR
jgi:hypothetical protein